ncbi:hypothetical protein L6654_41520 [Bradyrhizobium sp. WYCCWR 13023]|uniref:Right handed beta helix domain-containing protein n=2 Tax=Nitrobacteraceae TaxID=41294 RepID=A0A9X1UFH9_9BRAD|nr:hypothetical protein [Bradyrhizobium zhengyangense]
MRTLSLLAIVSSVGFALLPADPAQAQATRTWVSGVGDDVNPCSRTAPCKTFAGAISKTAAGGEISVLDPGGFGAVTITKSISITNDGVGEAGILAAGTNGVVINAGPNDLVSLRGLVIDGAGTGINGIRFLTGVGLNVQNCVIKNFSGAGSGIQFVPTGVSRLSVSDTVISGNGIGSTGGGVFVGAQSAGANTIRASLSRVQLQMNGFGVKVDGSGGTGAVYMTVSDTVVSANSGNGLWAVAPQGASISRIIVDRTSLVNNAGTGILSDGAPSAVLVNNSVVTGNTTGISFVNGGSLSSYKTNAILFNIGSDGVPSGTLSPQ